MKKATCFFCYAWDTNERYKQLDFLRNKIENESNGLVQVILDKHSYEINADFDKLRRKIEKYDLVVVFCTPDLKQIVLDRNSKRNKDREVLKEYDIIKKRFESNNSSVFPLILEGDKENALLELFSSKIVINLSDFEMYKNKKEKYSIPRQKKISFDHFMDKVISTTIFNQYNRSEEYEDATTAMYQLFGLADNYDIPKECLVIPNLYKEIRMQHCCMVVGRKGSGKSTFIHNFRDMDQEYYNKHYKIMIPLRAEDFNHELAYALLLGRHSSDKTIIEPYAVLCLFWQLYFVLQCIIIIRKEIEIHKIQKKDPRYNTFNKMATSLLQRISGFKLKNGRYKSVTDPSLPKAIFSAAVEIIDEYYSYAVNNIKEGDLILTSYVNEFTLTKVLFKVFGEGLTEKFLSGLEECEQKILISLDGFDSHSEDFRLATDRYNPDSEDYRGRKEYEDLFFRTLTEVITQIRHSKCADSSANRLGQFIDFCVVLPRDRVDIIKKTDRDSIKKKYGNLSWCGLELMQILFKRLEYMIHIVEPEYKISELKDINDIFERMDSAFSFFSTLPTSITMRVGENTMSMSLFNYILRMSIWRPRDVISNWSQIMTLMVEVYDVDKGKWRIDKDSMKYRLNEENIKLILKANAEKIIDEEFIGENIYSFRNIDYVLNCFQNMNEQNSVKAFKSVLSKIKFNTVYSYDMQNIDNKLLVLYQLGIIGLLYDKDLAKKNHYLTHVCFEFNEGMSPFYDFQRQGMQNEAAITIIFNPLFASRLNLRYNTTELIGDWSKEYLIQNFVNKRLIHNI